MHQGRPVEFFPPLMRDAEHRASRSYMSRHGNSIPGNRSNAGGCTASVGFGTAGRSPLACQSPEGSAMNRLSLVVSTALIASGSAAAVIVEQVKPTPTYEAALARSWEDVHNKVLTMAKD